MSSIVDVLPMDVIERIITCLDVKSAFKSMEVCSAFNSKEIQSIGIEKLKQRMASFLENVNALAHMFNELYTNKETEDHFVMAYMRELLNRYLKVMKTPHKHTNDSIEVISKYCDISKYVAHETNIQPSDVLMVWNTILLIQPNSDNVYIVSDDLQPAFQAFKRYVLGISRSFCFTLPTRMKLDLVIKVEFSPKPVLCVWIDSIPRNILDKSNLKVLSYLHKTVPTAHLGDFDRIIYPERNFYPFVDALHKVYGNSILTQCGADSMTRIFAYTYIYRPSIYYNPFTTVRTTNIFTIHLNNRYYVPSVVDELLSPTLTKWQKQLD